MRLMQQTPLSFLVGQLDSLLRISRRCFIAESTSLRSSLVHFTDYFCLLGACDWTHFPSCPFPYPRWPWISFPVPVLYTGKSLRLHVLPACHCVVPTLAACSRTRGRMKRGAGKSTEIDKKKKTRKWKDAAWEAVNREVDMFHSISKLRAQCCFTW